MMFWLNMNYEWLRILGEYEFWANMNFAWVWNIGNIIYGLIWIWGIWIMGKYEIWVKFVSVRKVQPEFTNTNNLPTHTCQTSRRTRRKANLVFMGPVNKNLGWIWIMVEYDLCVNMNYGWIWIVGNINYGWI